MRTSRVKLSANQIKAIHATHGHPSGKGLSLFDVKTKKKVHVKNPEFIKHQNGRRELILAKGNHPKHGHRVAQIVHHK